MYIPNSLVDTSMRLRHLGFERRSNLDDVEIHFPAEKGWHLLKDFETPLLRLSRLDIFLPQSCVR